MVVKVQHATRDHYVNGGSSFERRDKCRGSAKMELPFWDRDDSSDDSIEGTMVHEVGEMLTPYAIQSWDKPDKFEGIPSLDSPELKDYTETQIEGGKKYCLDILRILGKKAPSVSWLSEQRFDIDPGLELGGTADFACGYQQDWEAFKSEHEESFPDVVNALAFLQPPRGSIDLKVGHIWDYKNGTIPHNAKTSKQIAQYIAGLQHKLGRPPKRAFDVIFGHIYGPNARDRSLVTSVVAYTAKEIEQILAEQILVAEEALGVHGDDKLFLAAGEHCFFCKAKAVCPELDRFTKEKAANILDAFDAKKAALLPVVVAPVPTEGVNFREILATKTDEQIKEFWLHIEFFEKAISATKQYIIERNREGKGITGLKCVSGTTRRMYKKDLDAKDIGEKVKEWGVESPWVKVMRKLTDIEKEVMKSFKSQGMKTAEAEIAAGKLMDEITQRTQPGISIVLDDESDPRKSIELVSKEKATALLDAVPVSNV